jgi:outer membrane immunogenic protein
VIGTFGDYDFMNLRGTLSDALIDTGDTSQEQGSEKESGARAIGVRLGYAITPDFLTYVDGGYTQARFDQSKMVFSATGGTASDYYPAHTYSGWFLGSGTDTSLSSLVRGLPSGLFLRTEYRFASYEAANIQEIGLTPGPENEAIHASKYVQTVTTSLVWRFNIGGH